jgi:hypothetical protein
MAEAVAIAETNRESPFRTRLQAASKFPMSYPATFAFVGVNVIATPFMQ